MLDVKVKIDLKKSLGKSPFGYPLVFNIGSTGIAYTECHNLDQVEDAGFETTSDTYKACQLMFAQNNPPEKVAVCQSNSSLVVSGLEAVWNQPWRQLVVVGNLGSKIVEGETVAETIKDISEAVETHDGKMYFATVSSVPSGDPASFGYGNGKRTVVFVHTNALAVAALVGESSSRNVGSFTYKNLILNGINPATYSDSDIEKIHTANGLTFVTKAGDNVTTEGKVLSGEYIDIIDAQDYIVSNLEYQTQKLLNNSSKIPYDDSGIAMLESIATNVLTDAYNLGIIATNSDGAPDFEVSYAKRSESSAADREQRKYLGGSFRFTLSGAVHNVEIVGEILL